MKAMSIENVGSTFHAFSFNSQHNSERWFHCASFTVAKMEV